MPDQQAFATRSEGVFGRLSLLEPENANGKQWTLPGTRQGLGSWESPTAAALAANVASRRRVTATPGAVLCIQCRRAQPVACSAFHCSVQHRPVFAPHCTHGPFCESCYKGIRSQTLPSCVCRALVGSWREDKWPEPAPVLGPAPPPSAPSTTCDAEATDVVPETLKNASKAPVTKEEVDSTPACNLQRIAAEVRRPQADISPCAAPGRLAIETPSQIASEALRSAEVRSPQADISPCAAPGRLAIETPSRIASEALRSDAIDASKAQAPSTGSAASRMQALKERVQAKEAANLSRSSGIESSTNVSVPEKPTECPEERQKPSSMSASSVDAGTSGKPTESTPELHNSVDAGAASQKQAPATGDNPAANRVHVAFRDAAETAATKAAAAVIAPTPQIFKRRLPSDASRTAKTMRLDRGAEEDTLSVPSSHGTRRLPEGDSTNVPRFTSERKGPAIGARKRRITAGTSDDSESAE